MFFLCYFILFQGGLEAERRERERIIQEEHDKMPESILALLKNRGKRNADNRDSNEEEIEAIENEKKKYLEKVNEGRENKIEKVEVFKVDIDLESDKAEDSEEKTKGELFAE